MKNIKHKFAILPLILIAFLGIAQKANADGEILFGLNNISSKTGQQATLALNQDTVTNSSPEAPALYSFRVTYDTSKIDSFIILPGLALGATPLKTVSCSVVSAGVYDCQITGDTGTAISDGQIALLVFNLKSGLSNGSTDVTLSNVVATGITPANNNIAITSNNGTITIDSATVPTKFSLADNSGNKGDTLNLNVTIDKTGVADAPDALLWDVLYNPSDVSAGNVIEIPAMTDAGVSVSCLIAAPGDYKCLVSGYSYVADNVNNVVTIPFTISGGTSAGSIPVSITGALSTSDGLTFQPTQVSGGTITVNNPVPTVAIGSPSASITKSGPITYTITYTGADVVTLVNGNVTLNKTDTADGTAVVSGSGTASRTVTISGITGDGTLGITLAANTSSNTGGSDIGAGPSVTFTADNTAPTVPVDLVATAVSISQIDLSWTASTDTNGVTGYKIYKDGTQITTVISGVSYQSTELSEGTSYAYTVSAFDTVGNESAVSGSVSATTQTTPAPAPVVSRNRGGGGGGGGGGNTSTPVVLSAFSAPVILNKTLTWGMIDNDVIILQNFLIKTGYLKEPTATNFFGNLTREAVKKFQCVQSIVCSGNESTTGYGMAGQKTRNAITTVSRIGSSSSGTMNINDLKALLASLLKQVAELQAKLSAMKPTN
jgi:hypothetical protein